MIFSEVINHMIDAVKAVNSNDPNAILIADATALEMVRWYPAIEEDKVNPNKLYRVWTNLDYEKYTKSNSNDRLEFFAKNGPYKEYLKSKNPKNGISIDLENALKYASNNKWVPPSNNSKLVIGLGLLVILGIVLVK